MSACPMLLLLLILLGPMPASPQPTYQDFQRKHMDYPKTSPQLTDRLYCNLMMQRRGMTRHICKYLNSFIHNPANDVDAICTTAGTRVGNYTDSHASFNLTNCEAIGGRRMRPPCNYRGWTDYRRIEVLCNNASQPVHFHRII